MFFVLQQGGLVQVILQQLDPQALYFLLVFLGRQDFLHENVHVGSLNTTK